MIVDNLKNAGLYYGVMENIKKALVFLQQTDFSEIQCGKYFLNDEKMHYIVSEYETKPIEESIFEAHIKNIDIQYLANGAEAVGYNNIDNLNETESYDDEKDVIFYRGEGDMLTLTKDNFMILFPEDGHMPGVRIKKPGRVKKIVIKVPVK